MIRILSLTIVLLFAAICPADLYYSPPTNYVGFITTLYDVLTDPDPSAPVGRGRVFSMLGKAMDKILRE